MLDNIGNPDPYLRDKLIYTVFAHWLVKSDIMNNRLSTILPIILDEKHLFFKIGEEESDSVFTRSFSVLLLACLLFNHRKNHLFTIEQIKKMHEKINAYFLSEKDLRGYIKEKGWAHAVAHAADAIDGLALSSELEYSELKELLEIIYTKICSGSYLYINEEDERLVTAIISILSRHILF